MWKVTQTDTQEQEVKSYPQLGLEGEAKSIGKDTWCLKVPGTKSGKVKGHVTRTGLCYSPQHHILTELQVFASVALKGIFQLNWSLWNNKSLPTPSHLLQASVGTFTFKIADLDENKSLSSTACN